MLRSLSHAHVLWIAAALIALAPVPRADAQTGAPRFLGKEDILLYGIGLKVDPAQQTVPKDIATIVSTYLQAPNLPNGIAPFSPDAEVRATLAGPSFATPRELVIRASSSASFQIPPLPMPGVHTLENIRLVSNGEVLLYGSPQSVRIEVIERLLVTQVTARPLTAAEIRERGIVFDRTSFQAYNFTAAFAVEDRKIDLNFPVLLPTLQGAADQSNGQVQLQTIAGAQLPTLQTIIPDTLRIQTQVPNLSVVGFTLKAPALQGQQLVVPPIPGVIAIPGDIGFLNQFFSVMLLVGNVAPAGSNLVVSNLQAEIVLPQGTSGGLPPLRMAQTSGGPSPTIALVVQPGLDGKLGTADDVGTIGPGETGNAEYLVEGRREGTHVVEMAMSGTLNGLPVGPVPITGRAAGAVLVRNPKFTLTFTHPETVSAGEAYTLDVTVTNTSSSPANLVSVNLYPQNISGAVVDTESGEQNSTRQVDTIAPGDSATVSFPLISRITGKVTAATLDSDENVAGRFALKTAVGELGVPLSPDSLVLPKEASTLPKSVRDATIALLGKAWAVATAPPAAAPAGLSRFSRKIVLDRAVETAEAGLRVSLREPVPDSVAQLAMDFIGSNYGRLASLVKPADLAFEKTNFEGFDEVRRKSVRGDGFATAVAGVLANTFASQGAAAFHEWLAGRWSYRPAHLSVLAAGAGGAQSPYELTMLDASGRRIGGAANGKVLKEIAFGDFIPFTTPAGATLAELAVLAAPTEGAFTVRLTPRAGVSGTPFVLSLVLPNGSGGLRRVVYQLGANERPAPLPANGGPIAVVFEMAGTDAPVAPVTDTIVADAAPTVISVIQQRDADQLSCTPEAPAFRAGRIVAVLFSEEVTLQSAQDRFAAHAITNYLPDGNRVVGVALQPGRRIAFIALRDPIGPFVARTIAISNIADSRGHIMGTWTGPMETTVSQDGARVSGRILDASGAPMPFADVRLFYQLDCGLEKTWVGIAAKQADANGVYSWDYVARPLLNRILAVNTATDEFRNVQYNVQRQGQHLNVDIVFLGRGTIRGITRSEQGVPLADTQVRVTSLTDQSQYGARTDGNGRYVIARVPVGPIFIEAVNTAANAEFAQAEMIPSAGAVVERDLVLLDVEKRKITVKHGTVRGFVLRADGVTPAPGLPVFAYYSSNSQPGVACPPGTSPCPIARTTTDTDGSYDFTDITAGELSITSFDQTGLSKAEISLMLAANATVVANLRLSGGLGTVQGKVLTADGDPVQGAQVGGGLSLAVTDDEGEFTLTDVPVGRREIVAVSQALGATGRATIDIVRPGETVPVTIVFGAQGGVAGRVVHADGVTPAVGVTAYVFRSSPAGSGYEIVGSDATDAEGYYQVDHVPAGAYKVSAFSAGFADGNITSTAVKFNGQISRADIRFRGGNGKITGVVLNAQGNTPLKARVGVSGDRVRIAGGLVGVGFERVENFAIADSDLTTGQFALSGILVGPFTLNAIGQFSPDPISVEGEIPSPGATVNVELKLQPTSEIRGTVLNADGTAAGADIVVRYKSEEYKLICSGTSSGEQECESIPQGIQEENVTTDSAGRFWLPLVNAGSFTLTVDHPDSGRIGQVKGSVRPGEEAEVPLRLLARAPLQVRVLGSNNSTTGIANATVVVTQLGFPKLQRQATTGANGVVTFDGGDRLTEGDFVVEAVGPTGFTGRASGRIEADSTQVITDVRLSDATGTVHGVVYAADGVTPVANADVVVANNLGPLAFAVTGPGGEFTLGMIPLGDVSVEVFDAKSGRRGNGAGRIDFDEQQVPINVVLSAVGAVKGIVLDSNTRAALKGWTVTLQQRSASGVTLPVLTTTTGVDGRFFIPGAGRGTFTLSARKKDVNAHGQAAGALDREGQIVEVPVLVTIARQLTGSITGNVVTSTGAPAGDSIVEICVALCGTPTVITAGPDGTFRLDDVALARFTVTARPQAGSDRGSAIGELRTDGEVVAVLVAMEGVARVFGAVTRADGSPVDGAEVVFEGFPGTACGLGGCTSGTNDKGEFSFPDQPARQFTITATETLSGLKGTAGGPLAAGEDREVRIVLAPTAAVSGRVLTQSGQPAGGIIAELILREGTADESRQYKQTLPDGSFVFPTVPLAAYRLKLADPVGSGIAQKTGQVTGAVSLGDIVLDESAPLVAALTPQPSSTRAPLDQPITIVFSEPIRPGTIDATNVVLSGPNGPVTATRDVVENDTKVVVTPLADLTPETRYTVRVGDIVDRSGKVMAGDYTAAFTTKDIQAPTLADASPAVDASGVTIFTPIRLRFSEPVDRSKFSDHPIALTGPNGTVPGRLDYILGDSVLVYTPNLPLAENTVYQVQVEAATDLAGNQQATGLAYQFATTDRTPPQILELVPANDGKVIENGTTTVEAKVGPNHDVLFVDFYLNGSLAAVDRSAPFVFGFQATPQLGTPGNVIQVSAVATDTSANRGEASTTPVTVTPDQAPAVTIVAPAGPFSAENGDHIVVDVRATDDLGVKTIGYRAQTGNPAHAESRPVMPPAPDKTERFAFDVPLNADPGSVIAIEATAIDTFGHSISAAPVLVTVLDAVSPVVTITGATTGTQVAPGQEATVVVTATDKGGVASIAFAASGVTTANEARAVSPAQKSAVTSFAVTVPTTAQPGQSLVLDATAVDVAGNSGAAARVILSVIDSQPPVVSLAAENDPLPGSPVRVVVTATDQIGITRVNLSTTGAVVFADAKQVTPPLNSATVEFDIPVPATVTPGSTLEVRATATDIGKQTSAPVTLTLTIGSGLDVTLPASAIVNAGETLDVEVTLGTEAPAGGLTVAFTSSDADVVEVPLSLAFAQGEKTKMLKLTGVAGGTAQVHAKVNGVTRATMTATVAGGIVSGTVRNSLLDPVAGAAVTVSDGAQQFPATTNAAGHYSVTGVVGPNVTVRVTDPATKLYGYGTGAMTLPRGTATVPVVLIPAGAIAGHVEDAGGAPAGAGVRVDIFTSSPATPLATTFTGDGGVFEFPLVTLGNYTLQATSGLNRGRTNVSLSQSGEPVDATIVYLGAGTVTGTVRIGGLPVPNAKLTFESSSIFGRSPKIETNADVNGKFSFTGVSIGSFTVTAEQEGTGQKGSATRSITFHEQSITADVNLASYGAVAGVVRRTADGPIVAGATVTLSRTGFARVTETDGNGEYRFDVVPLGAYAVTAHDSGTRGTGSASVNVDTHQGTESADIVFLPQGKLHVIVRSAQNAPVPDAYVRVDAVGAGSNVRDTITTKTGSDGKVLIEHVLAGTYSVSAVFGSIGGVVGGSLAANELKDVEVSLQRTASLTGRVFGPIGQAPVEGARVSVSVFGRPPVTATTNAAGEYRIDGLTAGKYEVSVFDASNRLRARASDIVVGPDAQDVARDFTMIGLGVVKGRVFFTSNGQSAGNMAVTLSVRAPGFQQVRTATTDGGGVYRFEHVPVGPVEVVVSNTAQRLYGDNSGTLQISPELELDIPLTNNAITLPRTLWDANNRAFDIQAGGQVHSGTASWFIGDAGANRGAFALDIVSGGDVTRFTGGEVPTIEDAGREIAVRQESVFGLSVTRKVFVPQAGYFARYLEILRNPTDESITVDVRVTGHLSGAGLVVEQTSNGDNVLNVSNPQTADTWLAARRADGLGGALVFDGEAATDRVDEATFTQLSSGTLQYAAAVYSWKTVTVPAGGTVAFIHFGVQQLTGAAAVASAERLASLPPEAVSGLSADEIAAIQNFAVPADGESTVPALPALSGTISGKVLEGDEQTAIASAKVRFTSQHPLFPGTYNATATATGSLTLTGALTDNGTSVPVPVFGFTLQATHPATDILSPTVGGSFDPQTGTASQNVVFANAGALAGSVRRHNTHAVLSGEVTITGGEPSRSFTADIVDAAYRIGGVPPGAYTLKATMPNAFGTGLTGTATATVTAGPEQVVNITMEPTGTLSGVVSRTTGPASGVKVKVQRSGFSREINTGTGGAYVFADMPTGTFTVSAIEPATQIATSAPVTIVIDTETKQNLTLVVTGRVTGVVKLGTATQPNLSVSMRSAHPSAGTFPNAVTGPNGEFAFDAVPEGAFTVTVNDTFRQLFGEASDRIQTQGQEVPVTIALVSNSIALPTTLFDANNFPFDIQRGAQIGLGLHNIFGSNALAAGAARLELDNGAGPVTFAGDAVGTFEDGGREIASRQSNVAGVNVTRKVFVPRDGYFARYLDLLSNTSGSAVSVTVRLRSQVGSVGQDPACSCNRYRVLPIVTTSSGDPVFDVDPAAGGDRWLTLSRDGDLDPFLATNLPPVSFVFGGENAPMPATGGGYLVNGTATLAYEWHNVTILPGQTFALMHFVVQQANRAGALASAERLAQMPPEALAGLSGLEIAAIRNFDVPANGTSALPPLPPLTATIQGQTQSFDGTVGVPFAEVVFKSQNPFFGRTRTFTSNFPIGMFSVTGTLGNGNSAPVPAGPFTLRASHPLTGVEVTVSGTFATGATTTTQNVPFAGTGTIVGNVTAFGGGVPAFGTSLRLEPNGYSALLDGSGSGVFTGIRPGSYTLVARRAAPAPQSGSAIEVPVSVQLAADKTETRALVMPPVGQVSGQLRLAGGGTLTGRTVNLTSTLNAGFSRNVNTVSDGRFVFSDIPEGVYRLRAFHPQTGAAGEEQVTVIGGQTTSEDLELPGIGSVTVTVSLARGGPAVGSRVEYSHSGTGGSFRFAANTDGSGQVTIAGMPVGAFSVKAYTPGNFNYWSIAEGTLTTDGGTAGVAITLPSLGQVHGTLSTALGAAVPNYPVQLREAGSNAHVTQVNTNDSGEFRFTDLPIERGFYVLAFHKPHTQFTKATEEFVLHVDGEDLLRHASMPAVAAVRVEVRRPDGSGWDDLAVELKHSSQLFFAHAGYTNDAGDLTIATVPEGAFTVRVRDTNTGLVIGERSGSIAPADDASTLQFAVSTSAVRGTVKGRVLAADATTVVSGARVTVYEPVEMKKLGEVTTGADGRYEFPNVLFGPRALVVEAVAPYNGLTKTQESGTISAPGATLELDLTLPVTVGTISGVVRAATGNTPLADVAIVAYAVDSGGALTLQTVTNAQGFYEFPDVAFASPFTVVAKAAGVAISETRTFSTQRATVTIDFSMPVVVGTVEGVLYAGDQTTKLPGVEVFAYAMDLEQTLLGYAVTDDDGRFSIAGIHAPGTFTVAAEVTGIRGHTEVSFPSPGGTVTRDLVVPVSVIKGRVTRADTSGVARLSVFVEASDLQTYTPHRPPSSGNYLVLGAPSGPIHVTVQDQGTGMLRRAAQTIVDATTAVVLDLALPATGIVTGDMRDGDGNVVPSAMVSLLSDSLRFEREEFTAENDGSFTFTEVPAGPVMLSAVVYDENTGGVTRYAGAGTVAANGSVTINVRPAPGGQVSGRVRYGSLGFPDADVWVRSVFGGMDFEAFTRTDANGVFSFDDVPAGLIYLRAERSSGEAIGAATGTLPAGGALQQDIVGGTGVDLSYKLIGADGFRYEISNAGTIPTDGGGSVDGTAANPYSLALSLEVNGDFFCCESVGRLDANGRQITLGPLVTGTIATSRSAFVPASGGFARFVDTLHNSSNVARTVTVRVYAGLRSGSSTRWFATPESTAYRYAVSDNGLSGAPTQASVGYVMAGAGAVAVPVSATRFEGDGNNTLEFQYTITVPPQQRVAVMYFTLQRSPGDAVGAASAADGLSRLSDPNALVGLTAAEKATIVNFVIP